MATEQIKTPYDKDISDPRGGLRAYLANVAKAEGYRQGVADTEARYAELVNVGEQLELNLRLQNVLPERVLYHLQAALAELKGVKHDRPNKTSRRTAGKPGPTSGSEECEDGLMGSR